MASKTTGFALLPVGALRLGVGGCATDDDEGDGDYPEWTDGKADGQQALYYRTIVSTNQFNTLALANGGVVIQGSSMKFLIDRRKPSTPRIYFQNANYKING